MVDQIAKYKLILLMLEMGCNKDKFRLIIVMEMDIKDLGSLVGQLKRNNEQSNSEVISNCCAET